MSSRRNWYWLALAVMIGGAFGFFLPNQFLEIFGLPNGGSTLWLLGLASLGVFCGGYLLYKSVPPSSHKIAVLDTVLVAGVGTIVQTVLNFRGYSFSRDLLVLFPLIVVLICFHFKYNS